MSSTSAPFGMRPSFHPSGLDRAVALPNGIASAYGTGILKGQPVALNTSGNIIAATAGSAYQGAFAGHEFTDTTGRRLVSNQWVASTAYQTGSCVAYFYNDANIVYEIQADGIVNQSAIGDEANFTNLTAGSTTTGLSALMLDTATLTDSGNAQLRIIGLSPAPDNDFGDSFTIVQVQVSEHQNVADRAAY